MLSVNFNMQSSQRFIAVLENHLQCHLEIGESRKDSRICLPMGSQLGLTYGTAILAFCGENNCLG
jgi:hypothetical protein